MLLVFIPQKYLIVHVMLLYLCKMALVSLAENPDQCCAHEHGLFVDNAVHHNDASTAIENVEMGNSYPEKDLLGDRQQERKLAHCDSMIVGG